MSNGNPGGRKSEIEVADFDRLLSKLEAVEVAQPLRDLLVRIKESGQGNDSKNYI